MPRKPRDPPGEGQATRNPPARGRSGNGRFQRSIETAESDARAARLRSRRFTYRDIADEVGYKSESAAYEAVQRAIASAPREAGEEMRAHELAHLDELTRLALAVAKRKHLAYNNKGVVEWDGEALEDDAPTLAAARVLKDLSESRRRLLGLDAETKVNVTAEVRYALVGVDPAAIVGGDETPGD